MCVFFFIPLYCASTNLYKNNHRPPCCVIFFCHHQTLLYIVFYFAIFLLFYCNCTPVVACNSMEFVYILFFIRHSIKWMNVEKKNRSDLEFIFMKNSVVKVGRVVCIFHRYGKMMNLHFFPHSNIYTSTTSFSVPFDFSHMILHLFRTNINISCAYMEIFFESLFLLSCQVYIVTILLFWWVHFRTPFHV